MSNFKVEDGQWNDEPVVILRDEASGAEATIAPGLGGNCVKWSVAYEGQPLSILETPPTANDLRTRKFKGGIPILWPFPGRVRNARYTFNGTEYFLPVTDKGGAHHIHGAVIFAAWRVVEKVATDEDARLTLAIGPEDLAEDMRVGYPFDFELRLTFGLSGSRLSLTAQVTNNEVGEELPFGYGLHPYFNAPLRTGEEVKDRSALPVLVPASRRWPAPGGLPEGRPEPLTPDTDFQQWRPLGPQSFDHMYTGVTFDGDYTTAGFRDPATRRQVLIQADRHFREWVLFTQPNRASLCIEPYTCPPNAINLAAEGIEDNGLIRLQPGGTWQAQVVFEVHSY